MDPLLIYPLVGAVAGTAAGLLGIGGGLIIVPALALAFTQQALPSAHIMHLAVGTSLATIVFTALSSIYAHHRRGAVLWPLFARLSPGMVLGSGAGAALASVLPSEALRVFFGVFELLVAIQLGFNITPPRQRHPPGTAGMVTAGGGIGTLSSLVGIGGGTLTVPFLLWCRIPIHHAVATSSACTLPLAIAGGLGYMISGWSVESLPTLSWGYVYLPALAGIVPASMLFAPLGARLAHRLPSELLQRGFALFLAMVAGIMIFA